MKNTVFTLAIVIAGCCSAFAQNTLSVTGIITSQVNGAPLANVSIQITQLRRSVETNEKGEYEFTSLSPGRYTLVTHVEGFSDQIRTVDVSGSAATTVNFSLSITAISEEVTVTASGVEESVFESFQSVNSIGANRIREQAGTGIGDVLERESGVGKRSFGPGTSRPVIRGFDGDRVLVLQDGARNGSLASQSGDHGEPIDALSLERLEVIKGPATLLYGSNAIGGVVNAVTSDEDDPHQGIRGHFTALGATNNRQGGGAGGVEFGRDKLQVNLNGNFLNDGNYRTPFGRIPNSSSRALGGSTSVGYYAKKGFLVGTFSLDRRRYGVPYAPLFEAGFLLTDGDGNPCEPAADGKRPSGGADCEYDIFAIQDRFANRLPDVPDEEIDLRMKRNNYRLRGGFRDVSGPIARGNFYIDFTKYRHEEIETADGTDLVATNFFNDTFSYRGVLEHAKYGLLTGRFGLEGYRRNYLTEGAEQLIDGRVRQNNLAFFGLEELSFKRVALQIGGRVESNRFRPENRAVYSDRTFIGVSAAAAARFSLWEGASFIANFTTAYRAPALEELYNEGAHIGTVTFEIGDQNLGRERSNGIEFSLRQRLDRLRVNGSVFYYRISDFIFIAPEDRDADGRVDVEDNLPIGRYVQDGARFVGADVSIEGDIKDWLGAYFIADVVKAQLRESRVSLPRITPARARIGLEMRHSGLSVRPEVVFVGPRKLDDIFTLETPTAGYGLFNVNASYTRASERMAHTFAVGGSNLGDRLYRNHLSFIKNLAPEPGRGLRFSYTIRFF